MNTLLSLAALDYSTILNSTLYVLLIGGFVVAVVAGSVAWYNSKKPTGWENAEKPDWVPKVDAEASEAEADKAD